MRVSVCAVWERHPSVCTLCYRVGVGSSTSPLLARYTRRKLERNRPQVTSPPRPTTWACTFGEPIDYPVAHT